MQRVVALIMPYNTSLIELTCENKNRNVVMIGSDSELGPQDLALVGEVLPSCS
jgi:hypothetical protein